MLASLPSFLYLIALPTLALFPPHLRNNNTPLFVPLIPHDGIDGRVSARHLFFRAVSNPQRLRGQSGLAAGKHLLPPQDALELQAHAPREFSRPLVLRMRLPLQTPQAQSPCSGRGRCRCRCRRRRLWLRRVHQPQQHEPDGVASHVRAVEGREDHDADLGRRGRLVGAEERDAAREVCARDFVDHDVETRRRRRHELFLPHLAREVFVRVEGREGRVVEDLSVRFDARDEGRGMHAGLVDELAFLFLKIHRFPLSKESVQLGFCAPPSPGIWGLANVYLKGLQRDQLVLQTWLAVAEGHFRA